MSFNHDTKHSALYYFFELSFGNNFNCRKKITRLVQRLLQSIMILFLYSQSPCYFHIYFNFVLLFSTFYPLIYLSQNILDYKNILANNGLFFLKDLLKNIYVIIVHRCNSQIQFLYFNLLFSCTDIIEICIYNTEHLIVIFL